ncbi:GAF domain-containing protein [Coraliomargarita akajimensis]|uniref:histidine kinase n=1 Tax=Coraliomargarita akajimensis (strain DSM 45221 / IAM 15411 / JCM 23193 / KCTC 12865 / 04OKA010-24) TaxID=583355 RepID=D5EM27_CORAD|nr:GAF domain-containing protein [Coraliomargarita akajimensis]ADE55187.1 GAF sensor signal transduction histidine kinase [Coraliomargarita akajimensis DSM 45221]
MEARDTEHTAIDSLYRISRLVSNTEDPKVALDLILEEIINVLNPSSASISLINPDTKKLELEASYGLSEDWGDLDLALGQGITGWTALHGKPIIVPDVHEEPRYISIRENIRSEMAVPMEDRGSVIGVVNVDSEEVDFFGDSALKILTLLTSEASRVVTQLWLFRQLKTKANQLESLVNLGRRISGELDLDRILYSLASEGRQLMDCHCCALLLLSPDKESLQVHTMVGREGLVDTVETIKVEDSAVGAAVTRRKQVEVTDLPFTEENDFQHVIKRENLVSMLSSPIIFNDEVIGVINAYTRRQHRFNNDEKKVFETLSGLGAIAIQNARLYSRVFSTEESLRRNEKLTTLGMLAAEIAHEIRNPLTVIKLLFDSLDLQFIEGDARQTDVTVIGDKLNHLEEIVERVLSFGRNREGMNARYDLNRLTEDTLRLVRLKLHQQKIEIGYDPTPKGLYVEVNKGQIQQVMLNLILNATQVMPNGGRIHISTTENNGHANFTITDTGPGMPESIQAEIFESFLTHRPDGTGLGLSISKRILRSHHGNIELVESSPEGSTFRFWLPLG